MTSEYWEVAEWLNAADCKSAPFGVRGFESLPPNKTQQHSLMLGTLKNLEHQDSNLEVAVRFRSWSG